MSVYRVTEIIGTSEASWEDAAKEALATASRTLRDLRIAEVVEQDLAIGTDGQITAFRIKLRLSFKYEIPWSAPA
ncbi:MAG: dodecin family protein [Phenylobacterium sp.]|uniref:dodecin family protein n=1 Tax=Phenylobacterium sp. TaxID=1871053 RepID=UPI0027356722|nr:dodecin family protein [Phenylobacterium sp.]MDP3176094.1 dodecin family protein [Phenylobacterium sp.]